MGATYLAPLELRRLVVKFTRIPAGGISEDYDAVSFHFAKLTGGAVDSNWLTADYTAVEGRFDTLWTAIKGSYPAMMSLAEYRWYKDGPVFAPDDLADGPANPSVRTTARAVAGTGGLVEMAAPQVAVSLTKVVDIRKRWGRIFLPSVVGSTYTTEGRFATSVITSWLAAFVTFGNGCRTDGKQPVVWSRGRSAYVTSRGTHIDAHPAAAYEITKFRIDNNPDIVRSRRWSAPTVRLETALT